MDMKLMAFGAVLGAILCTTNLVFSAPSGQTQQGTSVTAGELDYLFQYGYVQRPDPRLGKLISAKDVTEGIKHLQKFAGLPVSGILDAATKQLMITNRCGMPDVGPADSAKRKRRYSLQGTRWNKQELTWRIHNYGNDNLNKDLVRATIMNSLKKWSDVTNLSFKELTTGEPDIWFKFVRGAHGDPYPFEETGGTTIAHGFYPGDGAFPLAGDVHYNDAKTFSIASKSGIDLLYTTVHELGHSLGLDHSDIKGTIMHPWYNHTTGKDVDLTPDDVMAVQTLYGDKSKPTAKIPSKATFKPINNKCFSKVGAIFLGNDEKTYVFNKDKLFILKKEAGIEKGPIAVSKMFKGVDKVDAVFKKQNDKNTIIFSGKNYYEFNGDHTYKSPPQPISQGFVGFPSDFGDIDAAFVWPGNNHLYIFKGDEYWRVDLANNKYQVATSYPRKISSAWKGVPDNITAVFAWRNRATYFFKGTSFYALNRGMKVDTTYRNGISTMWAQLAYCENAGNIIDGKRSGASRSALEITVATVAMVLASFLVMT